MIIQITKCFVIFMHVTNLHMYTRERAREGQISIKWHMHVMSHWYFTIANYCSDENKVFNQYTIYL